MERFNTRWYLPVFVWLWYAATTTSTFSVTWAFVPVPIRTLRLPVGSTPLVLQQQQRPAIVRRSHGPGIDTEIDALAGNSTVPYEPNSASNQVSTKRSLLLVSQPTIQHTEGIIPPFLPTWLFTLRHWSSQLLLVLVFYGFHMVVLSQHAISFPFQLLPNERGHFQSIGMDTLAGLFMLLGYHCWYRRQNPKTLPSSLPWSQLYTQTAYDLDTLKKSSRKTCVWLVMGFLATSFLHPLLLASILRLIGKTRLFPWKRFSLPMRDSISILFGHLVWVAVGSFLLRRGPRPQPLHGLWYVTNLCPPPIHDTGNCFGSSVATKSRTSPKSLMDVFGRRQTQSLLDPSSASPAFQQTAPRSNNEATVSSHRHQIQWGWWVIGGYYISAALFNVADLVNLWFLPTSQFLLRASQELNGPLPGYAATLLGSIAPCITAPWWEEVLYRGFLLPTVSLFIPLPRAILWTSAAFALNHLSLTSFVPLVALGWTWSYLYIDSGTLWTAMMVHALWNARVVLGAWLGL